MRAARNDVVARTFGRRSRQHRCFDVHETVAVQVLAHRHRHLVTQAQVAKHFFASEVEIAIRQAQLFIRVLIVMERRRFGPVQDRQLMCQHFDLTRRHVRVDRAFRALPYYTFDREDELAANTLRLGKNLGPVRVEYHLQQAFPVAQIDEDHTTVIAPAMHPATHRDLLTDQRFVNLSAIMASHRISSDLTSFKEPRILILDRRIYNRNSSGEWGVYRAK